MNAPSRARARRGEALPARPAVALVVCRDGRLPGGADEAAAEASGSVVVAGTGAGTASHLLPSAREVWWAELSVGPAALAASLCDTLAGAGCVILPASPDGRDLAPRLAEAMGRPLLAGAVRVTVAGDGEGVRAELLRVDGRVVVPADVTGAAVATLVPGARGPAPRPPNSDPTVIELIIDTVSNNVAPDATILDLIEPDPATMDLADAERVFGAGAGLVPPGTTDAQARSIFELVSEVAAALRASAGATRVVTDAGWADHQRQIGTTGVAIDPDLYIALGVSGATQHTGGLGTPRHVVSVNTDPSCPMTSMANLGIVADALSLLVALAGLLDVAVPPEISEVTHARV